jgi:hypothetical protein
MGPRVRALLPAVLAVWSLAGCGGSSGTGTGGDSPPPNPGGGTGQNPCATASLEPGSGLLAPPPSEGHIRRKTDVIDRDPKWRVLDALWTHRQKIVLQGERAAETSGRDAVDIGEIAILQDEGDLIAPPNQLDLTSTGLRFSRNGAGGYDVSRIDGAFRTTLGTQLTLSDDDSRQINVPFSFPFYGRGQSTAFVNSDGNITFEAEDRASTERNVARLLTGPPRVAPFLADLDPSAGGRVYAHAAADQYTVTWCSVRGFDSTRTVTLQATLLPDGTVEVRFGDLGITDTVVGVSPGRTGVFSTVDLSASGPTAGGSGAVGERFALNGQLDTVEIARKFYRSHPDDFDQLIIWTDARLIQDAFAYESTVANEISGIGIGVFDASRDFGSGGRLRSFAVMDDIHKYPDNPQEKFLGENSTVSVLGQEVGHRWLAFLEFRDRNGERSEALLGRGEAHWSFFFDSDASVMEGNDIEDLGGGAFQTVAAVERYSLLDQYAMGLVPESDVPPFFYVENPTNVTPCCRDNDDAPRVGVRFNGTRRDLLIGDVIAVHGRRNPSSGQSPRVHRQAFLFVLSAGRTVDSALVDKIDRIRREWETFFLRATDGRMRAQTTLQ